MDIRDHRPLIVKTLRESTGKFKSIEDFADHLIGKIETAEEVLAMYGGAILINSSRAEEPMPITSPAKKMAANQDISERIQGDQTGALRENFTKQEIREYCDQTLPQDIEIQPNGFAKPIRLFRRIENAPGDLNFVRIKYVPQGADMGAETMVAGTEGTLDAVKIMREIHESANTVMSPNPRRVEPQFSTPPLQSLDQFRLSESDEKDEQKRREGFAAETDERPGSQEVSDWLQTQKTADKNPNSLGSQWRSQSQ